MVPNTMGEQPTRLIQSRCCTNHIVCTWHAEKRSFERSDGWLTLHKKLEMIRKESDVAILKYYLNIFLGGLKKTTNTSVRFGQH
jgi:hypothetical protein